MTCTERVIRDGVPGVSLRPGMHVTVLLDGEDETGDERFHGRAGQVVGLFADDVSLVLVAVPGLDEEWFFLHELVHH